MKKSIKIFVASLFMTCAFIASCNSPAEKVEEAKDNVAEAQAALDKANEELLAEVENYRKETAGRIAANNLVIAELKETMKDVKESIVENLEVKSRDLQVKIDAYKVEGRDKWEEFKLEFDHDMSELAKAIADLKLKNVK